MRGRALACSGTAGGARVGCGERAERAAKLPGTLAVGGASSVHGSACCLGKRSIEQVAERESFRPQQSVLLIESVALDLDHSDSVPPLPFGNPEALQLRGNT